jgi:hypothetical protein
MARVEMQAEFIVAAAETPHPYLALITQAEWSLVQAAYRSQQGLQWPRDQELLDAALCSMICPVAGSTSSSTCR